MPDIAASTKTKASFENTGGGTYTFFGALETTNDSDWIRLQVSAGVHYRIFASFTETDTREFGDCQIALFNSLGQPAGGTTVTPYSPGPELSFTAGSDGFVYL